MKNLLNQKTKLALVISSIGISSITSSAENASTTTENATNDCLFTWCIESSLDEEMKPEAMDHTMHEGMTPEAMEDSKQKVMQPEAMDHSTHGATPMVMDGSVLPVSDGSAPYTIPMPFPGVMHMEDDPLLWTLNVDRLEWQTSDEDANPIILEADAWIGKDLNKLWLKFDVEQVENETEEAAIDLLYSRAILPYWDFQIGIKQEIKPESETWLAIGAQGLAPYFIETDVSLYAASNGQVLATVQAEYEVMLSQRAEISPEIELSLWVKDEAELGRGQGLADLSLSVRYSYAITREFSPYIGVGWSKMFGSSADYNESLGHSTEDSVLSVGFKGWF